MRRLAFLLAGCLLAAPVLPRPAAAADDKGAENPSVVKKTKAGLHFNVPQDWPIEERSGVVGPIPLEEYLARKFAALDTRLRMLEQQVNSVDLRLRVLEEQSKPQGGGLRSAAPLSP